MGDLQMQPVTTALSPNSYKSSVYQQALLFYARAQYELALPLFESAAEDFRQSHDYENYFETLAYVLRILGEQEAFDRIRELERIVRSLADSVRVSAPVYSRLFYVLGICSCYDPMGYDRAHQYFQDSIQYALQVENKTLLAYPLLGIANVAYARKQYREALEELDGLDVLLSCLHVEDLKTASALLRGQIYRNQGHLDTALTAIWKAYEHIKENPNFVLNGYVLCALAGVHIRKGENEKARLYLDLAAKSAKGTEWKRLWRLVQDGYNECQKSNPDAAPYDCSFDVQTGLFVGRDGLEVNFENQFVLLDLLKMFVQEPARIFSKEDMVRAVWGEMYNPNVHDNKIYVTVKRLRQLVETKDAKTRFIMRAKSGYYLNPKIRVLVK